MKGAYLGSDALLSARLERVGIKTFPNKTATDLIVELLDMLEACRKNVRVVYD